MTPDWEYLIVNFSDESNTDCDSQQKLVNKSGKFEKIVNTRVKKGSTLDQTDVVIVDLRFAKTETQSINNF